MLPRNLCFISSPPGPLLFPVPLTFELHAFAPFVALLVCCRQAASKGGPQYNGFLHCLTSIAKNEGGAGCWACAGAVMCCVTLTTCLLATRFLSGRPPVRLPACLHTCRPACNMCKSQHASPHSAIPAYPAF